jgi:DNA-binding response OmpR family regulator
MSASPGHGRASAFGPQPKRLHSVLVVDDEVGARDSLRLILEPEFRVLTAERGESALRILERERISVMTLDLQMPGWSGPETLLKIREIDADLQVVIVTAYASYTEAMRALRLRAFDLLSKPFDVNDVMETVRRAAVRSETGSPAPSSLEIIDGLPNRLMASIHGLSASELRELSGSQTAELDDLRERAKSLFRRLKTP